MAKWARPYLFNRTASCSNHTKSKSAETIQQAFNPDFESERIIMHEVPVLHLILRAHLICTAALLIASNLQLIQVMLLGC